MPKDQTGSFEAAMKRPVDYHKTRPSRQWEIDEKLGLLDWDGKMTDDQRVKYNERFKLNPT